jgi:hypothetical protein
MGLWKSNNGGSTILYFIKPVLFLFSIHGKVPYLELSFLFIIYV